jgi:hypothetical protein
MFELKPLSPSAVGGALTKAERYRLLNEPEQCESICEDVLSTDPDNHEARIMLILAITDGFPRSTNDASHAMDLVAALPSEYDRHYYAGLVAERRGRAVLFQGGMGESAGSQWLHQAMREYERAEDLRAPGNDDARLRWNACARLFNTHPALQHDDEEEPTAPIMLE